MAPKEKTGAAGVAGSLDALTGAIESGAGLPAVVRAAGAALASSVAVIDRQGVILAVAAASPNEEARLLAGGAGVESLELRVADAAVGELRVRGKGAGDPALRMISTLLALEVERSRAPEWASDEAAGGFVAAVLERRLTDRDDLLARAAEVGVDVAAGAGVVMARLHPHVAQEGDWRGRALTASLRALRGQAQDAVAALGDEEVPDLRAIVPAADESILGRAATALAQELREALHGFGVTVAYSRRMQDPVDLYRAGKEALLATNVAVAEERAMLAFEDTGAYRLLLPAMSEDPGELQRFYDETVAPLAAYDEQYETELVATVEAYLANDGNVTPTAATMFTHRHTIRYRLERVKELSGHDMSSTEGREKVSLGLKAMRVLGIPSPRGPALEPGAESGRVPRGGE